MRAVAATILPAVTDAKVLLGGEESLSALATMIKGAKTEASGEIFLFRDAEITEVLANAWRGEGRRQALDGQLLVTAHPDSMGMVGPAIYGTNVNVGLYGGLSYSHHPSMFVHSKIFHIDHGERAWISSAAIKSQSRGRFDTAVTFGGASAKAAAALTDAAIGGDVAKMREAAQHAARHGVLVTDAASGVSTLARGIEATVVNAGEQLRIATKKFYDVDLARQVAQTHSRGVDTLVIYQFASPEVRTVLEHAGVPLQKSAERYLHGTIVANEHTAITGSGYLAPRTLGRHAADEQGSREVSVVVDGSAREELMDAFKLIRTDYFWPTRSIARPPHALGTTPAYVTQLMTEESGIRATTPILLPKPVDP